MTLHVFLFTAKSSAFWQPIFLITAVNSCSSMQLIQVWWAALLDLPHALGAIEEDTFIILSLAY